jgi:hypothetical protein
LSQVEVSSFDNSREWATVAKSPYRSLRPGKANGKRKVATSPVSDS